MKGNAVVVGSGFGGIASALRLRAMGYEVRVFEKLSQIGGRARVFKKSGYTFDAGPTVITAPFLFDELFNLFGKNRKNYVKFVRLDPWYRFYFSSNSMVFRNVICLLFVHLRVTGLLGVSLELPTMVHSVLLFGKSISLLVEAQPVSI